MKRSKALQNIVITSTFFASLPYCESYDFKYENLFLKKGDDFLLESISKFILPLKKNKFKTVDTRIIFLLTMVNDCFSPDEISNFLIGLDQLKLEIKKHNTNSFDYLEKKTKEKIIGNAFGSKREINFFINSIKQLSLRHFMTSENYMKKYLNYEFLPNRYFGKVPV